MTAEGVQDPPSSDARWTTLRAALARAVRRQCPRWLSDHAEDLAQAALMKIMATVATGEGDRPLSSFYLYRVAHSALVDEIRRRQRRREVALVEPGAGEERHVVPEPRADGDPERDASFRELGAAVRTCLLGMGADRRQAVMLYLQGHSIPDAGRLLGWSAKRVENLVYRGLGDLRRCLIAKGHTP
jgi:RNA polymerase sigma-70 factor (ECF subfamily)